MEIIVLMLLSAAVAISAFLVEREFRLWPIGSVQQIYRMPPTGSISQVARIPFGVVTGVEYYVLGLQVGEDPVIFNLRIRDDDPKRTILYEQKVPFIDQCGPPLGGYHLFSPELPAPVDVGQDNTVIFEVESDSRSGGPAIMLATHRKDMASGGVTINGSPTDPEVRLSISPTVKTRLRELVTALLDENFRVSASYGMALLVISAAITFMVFRYRTIVLLSTVPVSAAAMLASAIVFEPHFSRYYMTEISDAFWGGSIGMLILFGSPVMVMTHGITWIKVSKTTVDIVWRGVCVVAGVLLAAIIALLLIHLDDAANFVAAILEILILLALIGRVALYVIRADRSDGIR
tara:strand:- start:4 stop:1047 length:1044 start_codon:yes stop_codon:yes gene_type:complete